MMKRIYEFVAITFWVVGTPWYGWLVIDDLLHPERWDADPLHDPRIYLPFMLLTILFMAWCVWDEVRTEKQFDRERARNAKEKWFFDTVKRLRAEGRWDEANEVVRRYQEWKKLPGP